MSHDLQIASVKSREVLDSRGNPTVETDVVLKGGAAGRAIVPSGASTGKLEAAELRDGGQRYGGKGVLRAVGHVQDELASAVIGYDAADQRGLDRTMVKLDGTQNKSRLGANAILSVSLAAAHAAAAGRGVPLYRHLAEVIGSAEHPISLPVPMLNIINGGQHADNNLDIQEYMVVPHGLPTFGEALRAGAEIYGSLRSLLRRQGLSVAVGDEGGFAPKLPGNRDGLDILMEAISAAGYEPGDQVSLALDSAASSFALPGQVGKYRFERRVRSSAELNTNYERWVTRYPLVSLEDPLCEEDWDGWIELTRRIGDKVQVVGDDIFVTHAGVISEGVRRAAANSVLVKVNQIGTLTEAAAAVAAARDGGWTTVISHRSGETEDTTIADLAVAFGAGQIKTGAPCRSERVAKYNRLLRIEEELGEDAVFAGWDFRWAKRPRWGI